MENVIAMDGPSGSGKSTMAKKLAKELGVLYIDTGAMFRAIACYIQEQEIELDNSIAIGKLLPQLNIEYGKSPGHLISIDGVDYSHKIREHIVSRWASIISELKPVRVFLLKFQRELASKQICVMEGRDIGSVVFPDAFCKIFVTASSSVRAKRRLEQLHEQGDFEHSFEQVLADVEKRDKKDMEREVAPLKIADGATVVDTSNLNEEHVLLKIVELARSKATENGVGI
jgi:cytidylate kinase